MVHDVLQEEAKQEEAKQDGEASRKAKAAPKNAKRGKAALKAEADAGVARRLRNGSAAGIPYSCVDDPSRSYEKFPKT